MILYINMENLIKKYFINYKKFNPQILKKDENILNKCKENKCGNYNKNYMCPPLIDDFDFSKYSNGFILQQKYPLENWRNSKIEFHLKILKLEEDVKKVFQKIEIASFIGGSCELCNPCMAVNRKECQYPAKARPSLESCGINVLKLLKKLNLPSDFCQESVTWTGAILLR